MVIHLKILDEHDEISKGYLAIDQRGAAYRELRNGILKQITF